MYEDLKGKVAIVTGARRGMGRTHALVLAKAGVKVIVSDISQEDCEEVVKEIENAGGEALAVKCDVSKKAEVDTMIKKTIEKFGRVDILVNNAGIYFPKSALELTEEDWDKMIDINLKGQFFCAQAAAREMAKQKWGRIINIASIASGGVGIGFEGAAHYAASKGGIIGMTESLAIELAPFGITVNAIAPGAIDTPMVREPGKELVKELTEEIKQRVPLKRMGRPEEVSNLVLFLASEASSYMTGSTVVVDGGWLAG